MSVPRLPPFAVLSVVSIFCMLVVAFILMTDILQELGIGDYSPCLLIPVHLLAQCCAWERIRGALYTTEDSLDLWSGATASGSVLVDWVQFAALVHRLKSNDTRWIDAALMLSLVSIFFEDFVGMVLVSLPAQGKPKDVIERSRLHLDTFIFKQDDLEIGIGKPGFAECPCHICLEELQAGEHVAKLLCGHIFHEKCIEQWLQKGSGCPLRCQAALGLMEKDAVAVPSSTSVAPTEPPPPVEHLIEV
mmetsp:Transcript_63833/g.118659  ORF Transcript_63833/g.118659 Transcript_63833/m.118659 type:complete len:247 (-) Transcript_63833:105-845(-)